MHTLERRLLLSFPYTRLAIFYRRFSKLITPKICEGRGERLDEVTEVMKNVDKLLNYRVEGLSDALKENLHTKEAFKEIVEVIGEASTLIHERSEGRINIREL